MHRYITRNYHNKKDTSVKRNTPKITTIVGPIYTWVGRTVFLLPRQFTYVNNLNSVNLWYRYSCIIFCHTLINSGIHCVKPGKWNSQCTAKFIFTLFYSIFLCIISSVRTISVPPMGNFTQSKFGPLFLCDFSGLRSCIPMFTLLYVSH